MDSSIKPSLTVRPFPPCGDLPIAARLPFHGTGQDPVLRNISFKHGGEGGRGGGFFAAFQVPSRRFSHFLFYDSPMRWTGQI